MGMKQATEKAGGLHAARGVLPIPAFLRKGVGDAV